MTEVARLEIAGALTLVLRSAPDHVRTEDYLGDNQGGAVTEATFFDAEGDQLHWNVAHLTKSAS